MTTLVVSDLHIGAGHGRARLDDERAVSALADAAASADRLVLLGDLIELRQLPMRDALAAAARVLPSIVAGMAPGSEVVVLAGNHDHQLLAPWITRAAASGAPAPLAVESAVDWVDGEPLAALALMLGGGGARVRAAYPGVWLRDDVFATHGHYLDAHTTAPGMERLSAGLMGKLLGLPAGALRSPDHYERVLVPIYAWMLAISERGGPEFDGADGGLSSRILRRLRAGGVRGRALQAGVELLARVGAMAGLGELSAALDEESLHRAELRAIGRAVAQLRVDARYVIFGHTHRAGPLPGDDAGLWVTPTGNELHNSGCWVQEGAAFMDPQRAATSPYRAGFAVVLEEHGPPRLLNLLDA